MITACAGGTSAEEVRRLQLRFAGEVLAVYVHEANNRLATLQETVGLLSDLLRAAGSGKAGGARESLRAAAGLEDQISLLAEHTRRLDGFSERLKASEDALELPGPLEELLDLTARLARQGSVRVERDFSERVPRLPVEPAAFLHLAHHLMVRAFALLPPKGVLRICTLQGRGEGGIRLALSGDAGGKRIADDLATELVRRLGGRMEEGAGAVEVWFPDRSPTGAGSVTHQEK